MGKNSVEVIVFNGIKWFNEKHIEEGLDHANLTFITRKDHLDHRENRYELGNEPKKATKQFLPTCKFSNKIHNELQKTGIMQI